METVQKIPQRAKYGWDAPGIIYGCFIAWFVFLVLQCLWPTALIGGRTYPLWPVFLLAQAGTLSSGIVMLLYVTYGKFRHRDRMLSMIEWKGSENVLDVGTGLGLLLIGAAKRLTTGKAVGVDIWSQKDLSGNYAEKTWENATLEGVKDKVEILNQDASALSFKDESFDVILTNLCIHNIPSREGRDRACREIARVLKKGGVALVSDFQKTNDYRQIFLEQGLKIEKFGPFTTLKLSVLKLTKNGA